LGRIGRVGGNALCEGAAVIRAAAGAIAGVGGRDIVAIVAGIAVAAVRRRDGRVVAAVAGLGRSQVAARIRPGAGTDRVGRRGVAAFDAIAAISRRGAIGLAAAVGVGRGLIAGRVDLSANIGATCFVSRRSVERHLFFTYFSYFSFLFHFPSDFRLWFFGG
jgi:hypothetical protein